MLTTPGYLARWVSRQRVKRRWCYCSGMQADGFSVAYIYMNSVAIKTDWLGIDCGHISHLPFGIYNGHVYTDVIVSKLKLDWDTMEITIRLQNPGVETKYQEVFRYILIFPVSILDMKHLWNCLCWIYLRDLFVAKLFFWISGHTIDRSNWMLIRARLSFWNSLICVTWH